MPDELFRELVQVEEETGGTDGEDDREEAGCNRSLIGMHVSDEKKRTYPEKIAGYAT